MEIKDLKLTNKIIDNGLKEMMPSANVREIHKQIEYKKVIVTHHFMERASSRFMLTDILPIEIAKHIARNRGFKHYSLSYKNIDTFMLKIKFGNVPTNVFLTSNEAGDAYITKTLFLDLNTNLMKRIINDSEKEKENQIFKKDLNDNFFKNISEVDFLNSLGNLNIKKVAKSYNDKKDNYAEYLNNHLKEQLLKEANSFTVSPKVSFKKNRSNEKAIDFDKGNGIEIDFDELYGDIDIII